MTPPPALLTLQTLWDRRCRPVQLFQPSPQFIPAGEASRTVLTVWTMDFQKGKEVAYPWSQHYSTPAQGKTN